MNLIIEREILTYTPPQHTGRIQNLIQPKKYLHKNAFHAGRGYFAGAGTGIVTVAGKPARREIWLISLRQNAIIRRTWSAPDGTYFVGNLDPAQEYLILCRDYKRERAPFAWDHRRPATEMTLSEQIELLKARGFEVYDHDNAV